MRQVYCRMKPYIQPFERRLAIEELRTLSAAEPEPVSSNDSVIRFRVQTNTPCETLVDRLAYWEAVEQDGRQWNTRQSLREATANGFRNRAGTSENGCLLPLEDVTPLPNRRCLRYGTHGIHEYRGKFFPQLVRSLMNIAGVRTGAIVADPMSGSGTTPVEAVLTGCRGLGIDMNPLSVFLARTKCDMLRVRPNALASAYDDVHSRLQWGNRKGQRKSSYFGLLPDGDRKYLLRWFSEDTLAKLDDVSSAIEYVDDPSIRNFMRLSLSNILRKISWQKDDDLRVRKEVQLTANADPHREFLEELGRSTKTLLAFLTKNGNGPFGPDEITEGDARRCAEMWSEYLGTIDAVITSPPYATALPYLDTDRLSLIYLGLLPRHQHRMRDQDMIGNREITERIRREYWNRFASSGNTLPPSVRSVISRIHDLNARSEVGFRRKNLSSLLAKYFFDMSEVLNGIRMALKPGGHAFVIVGNNHTIAGGRRVEIRTASYLTDLARHYDFEILETTPMEMLVSRDIFRRNAVKSEEILSLRKPSQ